MRRYVVAVKTKHMIRNDLSAAPALYKHDVVAWSVEQARLLRAGLLDQIDIEHIADEIEDVGKSEERELVSRLAVLLAHLLRWQAQPGLRSASWERTLRHQRKRARRRLEKTPSLQPKLHDPEWVDDVWDDAVTLAVKETGLDITNLPVACPWLPADVMLEDWLP